MCYTVQYIQWIGKKIVQEFKGLWYSPGVIFIYLKF